VRVIARQSGAHGQAHQLDGAAFGAAIFQAFLHHQAGGHSGDFGAQYIHGGVLWSDIVER
jgi:hypothetical protein